MKQCLKYRLRKALRLRTTVGDKYLQHNSVRFFDWLDADRANTACGGSQNEWQMNELGHFPLWWRHHYAPNVNCPFFVADLNRTYILNRFRTLFNETHIICIILVKGKVLIFFPNMGQDSDTTKYAYIFESNKHGTIENTLLLLMRSWVLQHLFHR